MKVSLWDDKAEPRDGCGVAMDAKTMHQCEEDPNWFLIRASFYKIKEQKSVIFDLGLGKRRKRNISIHDVKGTFKYP